MVAFTVVHSKWERLFVVLSRVAVVVLVVVAAERVCCFLEESLRGVLDVVRPPNHFVFDSFPIVSFVV
ncbi:hypothetical protein CP556_14525 [Natrinema sp. CBA1119]|nr:hypothetical protein CP556_14525 [Natrinema sp. CBA1119]